MTGRHAEEFVFDIAKLAIVELMFHLVEYAKVGTLAGVVIILLVIWRHRQRLHLHLPRREVRP